MMIADIRQALFGQPQMLETKYADCSSIHRISGNSSIGADTEIGWATP
jgi:hypothetical protein